MPTNHCAPGAFSSFEHIPVFARFQWLNSPQVVHTLTRFMKPAKRGRKGYGKVVLCRWLMAKWLMRCTYRDLESMSGIDYSTFIKFRKRLTASFLLPIILRSLTERLTTQKDSLKLILDSSFIETYSRHAESGSEYFGYKKKNGFKLHTIIDYATRLPLLQQVTPGARADITWGENLIRGAPREWRVKSLAADKGYDSEAFVLQLRYKWPEVKISIPVRHFRGETWYNRFVKYRARSRSPKLRRERSGIERYFSRKKNVFRLGEERTRGLESCETNCYLTSIMEYLEFIASWLALFTKLTWLTCLHFLNTVQ